MRVTKLCLGDFRLFNDAEMYIGRNITAIAGNNGTGKSTILGILANSSQLRGRKTLLGKPFRGEFSELFNADQKYDQTGQKVRMCYVENGVEREAEFRTAWQRKGVAGDEKRFRVIPKRKRADGTQTESKIDSPVIYLGLSRLYPVGETDKEVTAKSHKWGDRSDEKWFNENYSRILSIHEPIKSLSSLSVSGVSSKSGTGVETDSYGPIANSSGQDNLGQILLAVLSFKKLKTDMGGEWDGGLLLIDEIDAALHPAAQVRLVDLLLKEASTCGFQVAFTTHSTVVLKELSGKNQHNPIDSPGPVEVAYLTNGNGALQAMRNPSWATLENGLYVLNPALNKKRVGVFTEDPEARWFAKGILDAIRPDIVDNIEMLDVSLGCKQILGMYSGDFAYFRERVVVLDGDVPQKEIDDAIPKALMRSGANIVRLPGCKRPESVLWDYLSQKPGAESALWDDLDNVGIQWASLVESPPETLFRGEDERNSYKKWLRTYQQYFERAHVVEHWVADNPDDAELFMREFIRAYNNVAKRTNAQELTMGKNGSSR